ncbi:hypothetical protein PG989_001040 [Apiospora arundinis]
MSQSFAALPTGVNGNAAPYILHVPDQEIQDLQTLLRLMPMAVPTWYNQQTDDIPLGVSRDWVIKARDVWLASDWRQSEARINALPNFTMPVHVGDAGQHVHQVHFTALFSARSDAVPVIFMHGWPGSFLEFVPMIQLLSTKYTPNTLPYHVIVPSIPDFGLSTREDLSYELTMDEAAAVMHELMIQLGFGDGYVVQGGDVGSGLARTMATQYNAVKAYHINLLMGQPEESLQEELTSEDLQNLQRSQTFIQTGMAYAMEHGTRPATIGLALSASPLALLVCRSLGVLHRIGEKFIEWADERQPLGIDTILEAVSFYWFTKTFPRSLWPYRALQKRTSLHIPPSNAELMKPFGILMLPREIAFLPKAWAKKAFPNMVSYQTYAIGGHFAALEQPQHFIDAFDEFLEKAGTKVV